MNKLQRIKNFMDIMEQISVLASKAERIGWDEIHSYADCTDERADCGWAMQSIASHINWWFNNSSDFYKEWELLNKNENA